NDTQIKKILELTARAYQVERISLSNYLMLLLLIYTGRRPMQIAQLETGDLFKLDGVFYINIPKVKQRGAYRKQFSKVQIPQNLFENLTYLINAVKSIVSETLNTKLNEKQKNKLPIFLNTYHFKNNTVTLDMIENGELKLSSYQVTTKIRRTINRSIGKLQIDFGEINSRRFRYTLGTKAAQMGYSPSLIANILDHSSTSSVMSYVHNTAENSRKINEAMNEFIKPIAKKFTEKNSAERELVILKDLIDKYFFASECESISFDSAINLLI
ncbi:site-specific integrase, partial [Salmonella enterica]|nr:site-specific integrase [Salmonella enterica]